LLNGCRKGWWYWRIDLGYGHVGISFICDCCLPAVLSLAGVEYPCVGLGKPNIVRVVSVAIWKSGQGSVGQPVIFRDFCSNRIVKTYHLNSNRATAFRDRTDELETEFSAAEVP